MEPDDLLCSQGPHDKTMVARCAQWRPQPATSLKAVKRIALSHSSMRAVTVNFGRSPKKSIGNWMEARMSVAIIC